MKIPTIKRQSLSKRPLWYDTNIPITKNKEELLMLHEYWKRRFHQMYNKYMTRPVTELEWIHFRMIYSRYIELTFAVNDEAI